MGVPAASAASAGARRRLAVWLAASVAVLVVFALGAAGYSDTWCAGCHAMRPFAAALRSDPHADVACVRCHGDGPAAYADLRAREAGGMWPRFVLSLGSAEVTGTAIDVPDAACASCHRDIQGETVSAGGLRMRHATCADGRTCVSCHAAAAHGEATRAPRAATMDGCVTCHDGERASARCDLCHAQKLPADRIARGPWAVTHGKDWERTHGLGDLRTCRACHPDDYCERCHGIELPHPESFPRTHGTEALQHRAECLKCHEEQSFCNACHGMPMPHPSGFLARHSKVAKGLADPLCAHCHPRDTCDACHVAHTHPGRTNGSIGGGIPEVSGS